MYEHLLENVKRQHKRAEIGVPLDCKLLISVGELSTRKNHKVVVEALQELPDDYWYVIVGKGDLKDELLRMDSTGRLKLLGFRTDIVELLHSSDLFVFPSLQEGLPVALMEAMAAEVPCIGSNIRGNRDLIKTLVNDENWTEELLKSHQIEKLPVEFSIKKINERMMDVYETL